MIKELDKLSKQYGQVNMVFFNPFIQRFYGLKVLQKIKKRYSNVNFILFFIDPTTIYAAEGAMNLLKADNTLFNQIYTVDEEDAKMYGFKYNLTPYSKIEMDEETKYDIYFCGATKNRQLLVIDIAKKFKNRVKTKWDLFYIKENEKNLDELKGLLDIKKISNMKVYRDTLKYVAQSNCILELITEEQSAKYTLRDYEAIVYGKKLLTNNKNIFDFPYYDSRYMKYFKSVEDIDVDWLKNREHVEYLFGNELFSPTKLLYRIMDNN